MTHSYKAFDGDVQALIEQCKDNIDNLTVALKHCEQDEAGEIQHNLELQQIALAALMSPGRKVFTCSGCGCESFDEPAEDDCHCFSEGRKWLESLVYTTPPAQLLRPVELPEFKVHSNQPCWPSITVGLRDKEWIEALRQQGYEVKS